MDEHTMECRDLQCKTPGTSWPSVACTTADGHKVQAGGKGRHVNNITVLFVRILPRSFTTTNNQTSLSNHSETDVIDVT